MLTLPSEAHVRTARHGVATALLFALFATTRAEARKPHKAPAPLTPDQQIVVAEVVSDTFRRPSRERPSLALCLDVQTVDATDEDAPPPPPRKHGARKPAPPPEPYLPPVRGAPPELVERLNRPWRVVASALACSVDPRQPLTLNDAKKTPAQMVTVHLTADAAAGTVKIDWTDGTANNSRDCTAARAPTGWTVHCGGTWYQ
jgi:hypothetical protein